MHRLSVCHAVTGIGNYRVYLTLSMPVPWLVSIKRSHNCKYLLWLQCEVLLWRREGRSTSVCYLDPTWDLFSQNYSTGKYYPRFSIVFYGLNIGKYWDKLYTAGVLVSSYWSWTDDTRVLEQRDKMWAFYPEKKTAKQYSLHMIKNIISVPFRWYVNNKLNNHNDEYWQYQ